MMKKPTLALFLSLMSLLFISTTISAQTLNCVEANGLFWCYNDQECGQPCNDVCATIGSQPIASNTVWFEAQNTLEKCQAISQAFGLGDNAQVNIFPFACVEDTSGTHTGGGLIPPLLCSTGSFCPNNHRTLMDQQDIPCDSNISRRSICPCELTQSINLSPSSATNDTSTDHTVTAAVESTGIPEPGILVAFEVNTGPNAGKVSNPNNGECFPNDDCTTDENGQVSWTYSSINSGTDIIVASLFGVINSNPVEKTWVAVPIPTLSEWGLIAMAGVLGIVGFIVIRRRKLTA